MKRFEQIDVILWDFDGVIIDSVRIRNEGYLHVLQGYPEDAIERLLQFQNEQGGLSRYVKFRYFYEKILRKQITDEKVQLFADAFSAYMRERLTDQALLIEETVQFIRSGQKRFAMHIVSGSDGEELRFLCRELNIEEFFLSIHGSPTPKTELVNEILERRSYNRKRVVLIGDSVNDFEAAERNGILFYGYNNPSLKKMGKGYIEHF